MDQLRVLKKLASQKNYLHLDFWVPRPYSIDSNYFDEKASTYFLNENHDVGSKKMVLLDKALNLKPNSLSVNRLCNFVCNFLLEPEKQLYCVHYTEKFIICS